MTTDKIDNAQRTAAKVAGVAGLLAFALVVFGNYVLLEPLIVPRNAADTARNILAHETQFRVALICFITYGIGAIVLLTALQGLRDKGKVQPGHKVLINGASGGVGTFAVQLAKIMGADVTGVCSTRNVDLVKSLGADHVIDYTKEDFTKGNQKYDVILDNVANRSLSECRHVLTPDGKFVLIGGGGANEQGWIGPLALPFKAMIYSMFVSQKMGMMMAQTSQSDLTYLAELIQSGKLKPVIDRTYKLSETKDAMAYLEQGHARGKIVITVE